MNYELLEQAGRVWILYQGFTITSIDQAILEDLRNERIYGKRELRELTPAPMKPEAA